MFTVIARELAWPYPIRCNTTYDAFKQTKFYYNLYKKEGCSRAMNIWYRQCTVILKIVYS